jgi:hypothetical protein
MASFEFKRESGSIASVWITVIVILFVIMLCYMAFYQLIAITLYGMVTYYGGDAGTANLIITMFRFFPYCYLASIMCWAIVSSFRREEDRWRR